MEGEGGRGWRERVEGEGGRGWREEEGGGRKRVEGGRGWREEEGGGRLVETSKEQQLFWCNFAHSNVLGPGSLSVETIFTFGLICFLFSLFLGIIYNGNPIINI